MANDYFTHGTKLTPGTKARAEDVNARFDGVEAGLDKLPTPHPTLQGFSGSMAVGDASEGSHAISASQALAGGITFGEDSGTTNAYVVTMPIPTTSYKDGLTITFKAANACIGPSTINLDGLGVKQICRSNGNSLVAGDIAVDQIVTIIYSGTKFLGTSAFQGQFDEIEDRATALSQQSVDAVAECASYASQASADKDLTNSDRILCNDAVILAQGHVSSASNYKDETEGLVVVAQGFSNTATTKASEAAASAESTLAIFGDATDVQNALDAATASESATAADRIQTGLDRIQTGLDRAQATTDVAQTTADKTATGNDAIQTAADRIQTGLDRATSTNNASQTSADRTSVENAIAGFNPQVTALLSDVDDLELKVGGGVLGVGQAWQYMHTTPGLRAAGVTYTNNTTKPIIANVQFTGVGLISLYILVDGLQIERGTCITDSNSITVSAVIPAGSTYAVHNTGGSLFVWAELRE